MRPAENSAARTSSFASTSSYAIEVPVLRRRGRPPYSQIAIVHVLKRYPELWNKPKMIALALRRNASFSQITPRAVSQAISKIRAKHSGRLDIETLCESCLGRIIVSRDGNELVCDSCGRSFVQTTDVQPKKDQQEISNPLWLAYSNPEQKKVNGRFSKPLSDEALRIQNFGLGVKGKLARRTYSALAEICKSHPELGKLSTYEIARLVGMRCETRSKEIERVSENDVKDCITLGLLDFSKQFPLLKEKAIQLIEEISTFFPDVAATPPKLRRQKGNQSFRPSTNGL